MKSSDLLTILAGGVLAFVAYQAFKSRSGVGGIAPAAGSGAVGSYLIGNTSAPAQTIPNLSTQGQAGYGWQYFTDGIAIAPNGDYFKQGQLIWSAAQ